MNYQSIAVFSINIRSTKPEKEEVTMYIWKFFNSTSLRRPALVFLMALLLLSGLVYTQAPDSALGLRREDPTEVDPIGVGDDPHLRIFLGIGS